MDPGTSPQKEFHHSVPKTGWAAKVSAPAAALPNQVAPLTASGSVLEPDNPERLAAIQGLSPEICAG